MNHCHMIQAGEIQAVVGDCSRNGMGGAQYCGLWSLTSRHRPFNAFGNSYAGLIPGEIRGRAPSITAVDEQTIRLQRTADDAYPVDATATYRIREPYYVDHQLTIRDHASRLITNTPTPFREVSWCCYMNCPDDSRVHFRSAGAWVPYMSPSHGVGSNVAPSYVPADRLETFPPQSLQGQYITPFQYDRIPQRFDEPVYYGRLGDMAVILIFDTPRWLRFFLSPSGGGWSMLPEKTCPAWDFEWLIPAAEYRVGQDYTFRVRLVYKKFVSEDDVLEEYRKAQGDLGFERP